MTAIARWTAPLSPGQERLLDAEYVAAGSRSHLRPLDTGAVLVNGLVSPELLQQAVDALAQRQEALRTTFRLRRDAPPVQVIARTSQVLVGLHELTDTRGVPLEGLMSLLSPEPLSPDGRLFSVDLVRLGLRRHAVVLRIHHLVSDGWSIGVLYRELSELYAAAAERRPPRLAPLARSFRDHCVWMHGQRANGRFEGELDYWRRELAEPPMRIAFSERCDASPAVNAVDDEPLRWDARVVASLREASLTAGGPGGLAGPLLAALAAVLYARTGATDVRIGLMIAGRTHADDAHLIGNFVNTVVIRIAVGGETRLRMLVGQVIAKVAAAMDHQRVPIQDVMHALPAAASEPYQVTVALNTMRPDSLTLPGAMCTDIGVSPTGEQTGPRFAASKINLRWLFVAGGDGLHGTLTYRMQSCDKAMAKSFVADLGRTLTLIAAGGEDRVGAALVSG